MNRRLVKGTDASSLSETYWPFLSQDQSSEFVMSFKYGCLSLFYFQNHASSWPFLKPVDKDDVPDYYEIIKYAMGKNFACLLLFLSPVSYK